MSDNACATERLEALSVLYPALFPASFAPGYALYGFTAFSSKRAIRCRRLRLDADKAVDTVAHGLVMP